MRVLLFLAAAAALAAQPPLPKWSEKQVIRTVTNSPWAHRLTVPLTWRKDQPRVATHRDIPGADPVRERTGSGLGPLGGIGAPPKDTLPHKADLIVRWASALPVRQAKAVYTKKPESVDEFGAYYTLEIFGLPAEIAHLGPENVQAIAMGGAVLRTKSGRTLKPAAADVRIGGTSATVFIHFPRREPLAVRDEFIQIDVDLQILRFAERFLLKKLEYQGQLEL